MIERIDRFVSCVYLKNKLKVIFSHEISVVMLSKNHEMNLFTTLSSINTHAFSSFFLLKFNLAINGIIILLFDNIYQSSMELLCRFWFATRNHVTN